jgi:hypothetical protein
MKKSYQPFNAKSSNASFVKLAIGGGQIFGSDIESGDGGKVSQFSPSEFGGD